MTKSELEHLPVAIVGAGPVGLAAAAHLVTRNVLVKVYEAGPQVGTNIRDWGHVRVFTPWRYSMDRASVDLLERHGWRSPPPDAFPTGAEIVSQYLKPLAATPALAHAVETNSRITAISRRGLDKVTSRGREQTPFVLGIQTPAGSRRELARAVIDCSGTWTSPNPLGANGLPAEGEQQLSDRIAYGIPNVLQTQRDDYAGRTVLVVGGGHSAANVLLDLARLAEIVPSTHVHWTTRSNNLSRVYGGGDADQLRERGELGTGLRRLVENGKVSLVAGFSVTALRERGKQIEVHGDTAQGQRIIGPVDRIVVATGQRPDLSMTRELRLDLDPWLESAKALGPLIDPNLHSCGSVPPHGYRELAHPEPGFYTAGIKSYGRAPTFLLLTGYEQVRSIAAALSGDVAAANNVTLSLPETGVCVTTAQTDNRAQCCTSPRSERIAPVAACCSSGAA